MKKTDIFIRITDENRNKVIEILTLFGEKIWSEYTLTYNCLKCLPSNMWVGDDSFKHGKQEIDLFELRTILVKEKLGIGDYITIINGTETKTILINNFNDNNTGVYDKLSNKWYSLSNMIGFSTKDEIFDSISILNNASNLNNCQEDTMKGFIELTLMVNGHTISLPINLLVFTDNDINIGGKWFRVKETSEEIKKLVIKAQK